MSNGHENALAPNAHRLLWAGFFAILAAGIGFGVRGGILFNWKDEFGFSDTELGNIGGAGLTGFCVGIFIGGLIVDRIGYGKLVIAAFLFHILSAVVTFAASEGQSQAVAYNYLYWGMFIFAIANGTLEAVANPLVATLFPHKRTHYLNLLHASWPAGLVVGGAIGWFLGDGLGWHWKMQLALFLVPTVFYGLMFLGQKMPKSVAAEQGLSLGEMFRDVGLLGGLVACALVALFIKDAVGPMLKLVTGVELFGQMGFWWVALAIAGALWALIGVVTKGSLGHALLFVLFFAHALVGSVELGTDTWMQNAMGNLLTPTEGKILFVFTSAIMFILRFFADWIESRLKISPVGILLICAVLASAGLFLTSRIETFLGAMFALAVYAVGKTFFWPTMLAVVGDRFPRTGAVAMSLIGGIGMMAGGLIGAAGLGYAKDRFTAEHLKQTAPDVFATYAVQNESDFKSFLYFDSVQVVDGKRLGQIQDKLDKIRKTRASNKEDIRGAIDDLDQDERLVKKSSEAGDREMLRIDAYIPAALAVIFAGIFVYFMTIGGYRPVRISGD
ncbi:MAG TPA: MFS transporter [Pirellulaceae bacterium]|nr:MFS transporter [Pirellulaceae bacterium]